VAFLLVLSTNEWSVVWIMCQPLSDLANDLLKKDIAIREAGK
jgi:hypothetical protein